MSLYDAETGPLVYPVCSECRAPHVLRWCMSFSQGSSWLWQRDCKHKTAEAEIVDTRKESP